ncbi:MAG TPA: hypothetical protein DDW87_05065 [Firmicutes bacterium]|nr:hypothetical protein [Bacillota bacterium]
MSNLEQFKRYLAANNIVLEEGSSEDTDFLSMDNKMPSGPTVTVVIMFDRDDDQVAIFSVNYVSVDDPLKRKACLEKVNELNTHYSHNKFILNHQDDKSSPLNGVNSLQLM